MTLTEKALYYYNQGNLGCAVGMLAAANDVYGLGLTREACDLFDGFRTGMSCGGICGCLAGSMGVLTRMYGQRADFREICAGYTAAFSEAMGCDSTDCAAISPRYKTPEVRCAPAVEQAAKALEAYIAKLEAK